MREIKKMVVHEKTILVIDYSNLKEAEMMALVDKLKIILLMENQRQKILSIYNDKNFVTPAFMRHTEAATHETIHLIDKMAITGLSKVQQFILKGYNLLFNKNYPSFNTQEEAMAYLCDDSRK